MFKENQIFEGTYPPEAAEWCNESDKYHIEEIEPDGETRRYQIVPNPILEPTTEERIAILLSQLEATDYVAVKIAEGAATREEYADLLEQRQKWREQINELESI